MPTEEQAIIAAACEWQAARQALTDATLRDTNAPWPPEITIRLGKAECDLRDAVKAYQKTLNG